MTEPAARADGGSPGYAGWRLAGTLHWKRTMLFRAVVIAMLSSVLVLEVTGEVERRVSRAQLALRSHPCNDNRHSPSSDQDHNRCLAPTPAPRHRSRAARSANPGETILVDIRRAELDRLLGELDLTGQARIVPTFRDGAPIGVKLFAIRPGSLFAALGLRSGDLITTINDQSLTTATPDPFLTQRDHATFADITGRRGGHLLRIIVLVHS